MSGPIIRKYGFPNFEGIFGAREPLHGSGDEPPYQAAAPTAPLDSDKPGHDPSTHPTLPAPPPESSNPDDPTGRATDTVIDPTTSFGNAVE